MYTVNGIIPIDSQFQILAVEHCTSINSQIINSLIYGNSNAVTSLYSRTGNLIRYYPSNPCGWIIPVSILNGGVNGKVEWIVVKIIR